MAWRLQRVVVRIHAAGTLPEKPYEAVEYPWGLSDLLYPAFLGSVIWSCLHKRTEHDQ